MDKVLLINACTRPGSRTRQLTQAVLRKLEGTVEEVDLYGSNLTALGPEGIEKREIAAQTQDFSDLEFDLAKQFAAADRIVVAAPYWDLMFPSVLKLYLENITVAGITFRYDDVLIFADPYDVTDHKQDGYYTFPLGRFFGMWREGPCAGKKQSYQQPFVAAWPSPTGNDS